MNKIRLLLIIPTLDRSGAEKQCTLLASRLPRERFDVHVAVLTRGGPLVAELEAADVPYTVLGKSWKIDPIAYGKLKRLIKRFRPDIVHTWLFAANAYGRQAAKACGVKHVIAGERCVDPWKGRLHFAVDRYLDRCTEKTVTNSRGVVDFYAEQGFAREKFHVIPNAVLPPRAFPGVREAIEWEFDLKPLEPTCQADPYVPVTSPEFLPSSRVFLLGIVARLWPQKRLDEMIWVAESLQFALVDFHLMILGDGPERENLLRYRDEKRLFSCVHFLGHRNDAERFFPAFDVLLCPSAYEGQSNAILEAMSHGIPVIASDIPGNRELVLHGATGLLVPECDGDRQRRRTLYVQAIIELYEQEELRQRMGEAGRKRVQEEFTLEKMIERHVQFYETAYRNEFSAT